VVGELLRQMAVRDIVLGDHHDASRVLVEPMDDAGATHAADARKRIAAMIDQRVDQRAGPVAGAGMHDEAGGLEMTIRSSSS
jgi:hypothetical protein